MAEERTEELDTSTEQDSADTEHLATETEGTEEETSTEDTSPEGKPEGEEDETSQDWEQRYKAIQSDTQRLREEVAQFRKEGTQGLRQEDAKKFEEESKKRLDLRNYVGQYKDAKGEDDPVAAISAWAEAREQTTMRSVYNMMGPVTSQGQLTLWRTMKILEQIAPEVVGKQLEKEKAIKKVLDDVPALYNFPNYLDQAEKMALGNMSDKDLKQMEKDLEKKVQKSMEQQTGKSIPATKAPLKEKLTKEQAYKERIVQLGKRSTKLT